MQDHEHTTVLTGVYSALKELKAQQDQLEGCPTSCFSSLLSKILKVDTIPFLIMNENGPLELVGIEFIENTKKCNHFHTNFFRIEHLDPKDNWATLSLLRPLSLCGNPAKSISDVERLERTKICVTVDLSRFCAVQCLDINLLKKVVIEPKW
jgi:Spore coat protein Z